MYQRTYRLLLVFGILIGFGAPARAASQAVWQIGKFDQSSGEFRQGGPPAPNAAHPETDVLYIVGKSSPAADWPSFQPGSANGGAGFRAHPYTIQFDLPEAPRGVYTLKVAMIVETPRFSRLQVEINGHRGLLFQYPRLNYAGGDVSSVFQPAYSADSVSVDLPTPFLKKGTNQLVLTAVDEPAGRDDAANPGITYDALELDQDAGRKFSAGDLNVQVLPTIFYQLKGEKLRSWWTFISATTLPARAGRWC